ncbi:MAG: PPC domain-containing protein, partial [Planctomycetota bacterium]
MSDWLQSQYPQLRTPSMKRVLEQAAIAGVAQTPQQQLQLKNTLRTLQGKGRTALPAWRQQVEVPTTGNVQVVSIDNAFEHETNDGWKWADDMAGQTASGDCTEVEDVDCWRYVAATDGFYTFDVNAAGAFPIADSWLTLRNHKGDPIATNDNSSPAMSSISLYLPAGTYYLEVSGYLGTGGGTYDLVARRDDVLVASLSSGGAGTTQLPASAAVHDVFS